MEHINNILNLQKFQQQVASKELCQNATNSNQWQASSRANLSTDNADNVWLAFAQIYGSAFVSQFGDLPNQIWIEELAQLSPRDVELGIKQSIRSGSGFSPSLPQFLAYCVPAIVEDVYRLEKETRIRLDAPKNVASFEVRRAEMAKIRGELKITTTSIAGKEELAQRQAAMIQTAELLAQQQEEEEGEAA